MIFGGRSVAGGANSTSVPWIEPGYGSGSREVLEASREVVKIPEDSARIIHTCIHTYILRYDYTYMHTCIHIFIHAYIHS